MSSQRPLTCQVIRSALEYQGKQGFTYGGAISAESVGASGVCMHLVSVPPGAQAKPHLHRNHETAMYVLQGKVGMWYGEGLEPHLEAQAGDFLHIPAGMPHQPYNASPTEPGVAVLARTDPNEQESVVLLPEFDGRRGKLP